MTEEKPVECPRRFAGFVSLRGDICPPNPLRGRRLVNGKVKQVEKANERHVHSQDSWAHEATSARAVGSTWRKTLYVVGSNAFRRKKTIPLGNRSGKAEVISTASNFRMSTAPINSYPGIHAGAPLFHNYNGRSKEGIDFLDL